MEGVKMRATLRNKTLSAVGAAAAVGLLAGPAMAHSGHGLAGGLEQGLLHPLTGLDHLLAMVAVGLWAAYLGGRARWLVPAAFVGLMVCGALLALGGLGLPGVELGIALSVVALGLALAGHLRLSTLLAAALVGAFGLFHGHAHGAEAAPGLSLVAYGGGFVLTTLALHGVGLAIGGNGQPRFARLAGGGIAAAGLFLLI